MGTSASQTAASDTQGLAGLCCLNKRPDQKGSNERVKYSAPRTSGSFKAAKAQLKKVDVETESRRLKSCMKRSDSFVEVPAAKLSSSASSNHGSPKSRPDSASRRSGSDRFSVADTDEIFVKQRVRDWDTSEQKSLQNAVEMASAHLKVQPPGFFAIKVRKRNSRYICLQYGLTL